MMIFIFKLGEYRILLPKNYVVLNSNFSTCEAYAQTMFIIFLLTCIFFLTNLSDNLLTCRSFLTIFVPSKRCQLLFFCCFGQGEAQWNAGHRRTNRFIEKVANSERSPCADRLVSKQPLHFCVRFVF